MVELNLNRVLKKKKRDKLRRDTDTSLQRRDNIVMQRSFLFFCNN